jgi:hypothetical protein
LDTRLLDGHRANASGDGAPGQKAVAEHLAMVLVIAAVPAVFTDLL